MADQFIKSVQNFQTFDFSNNDKWKKFANNIYPTPTIQQYEIIRRKYYKDNIDSNFDIQFEESNVYQEHLEKKQKKTPENITSDVKIQDERLSDEDKKIHSAAQKSDESMHEHHSQHNQNLCGRHQQQNSHWLVRVIFHIEGFLKLAFILSFFSMRAVSAQIAILVSTLAIMRQCKMPKASAMYFGKLAFNEYFHNLWYLAIFYFFKEQKYFFIYIPLLVHFWIGLCEWGSRICLRKQTNRYTLAMEITKQNRDFLIFTKNLIEFVLTFIFIALSAINQQNCIFFLIIYINFVRIKYFANNFMKRVTDQIVERYKTRTSKLPKYIRIVCDAPITILDKLLSFGVNTKKPAFK